MNSEKQKFYHSLVFPFFFLLLIWLVKIIEVLFNLDFSYFGIYPLTAKGLIGIIASPLIHSSFSHLFANSIPLFVLSVTLFYFYKQIAYKVFFLIYLITGIWVWFGGREAFHIGASGLVYGLAAFLFVSGLIRKNPRLLAITLIVTFLYGSMIWGIFPDFFPEKNISWESHLMGLVAGLILAFYYRKTGPQPKRYEWEDDDDDDDENAYWKVNPEKTN
ncbi:MAG: rhomboid family intramembrane serine protease [Bacteroidetes bacterium]|nr:rhomboid family intramembrane serine protease [Bacteroidota bacterium]